MSIKTYDAPKEENASEDFSVTVNGEPVFVYQARVSAIPFNQVWPGYQRPIDQTEIASFAYWDMSGSADIRIQSSKQIESVNVKPASLGIKPEIDGNTISFTLERRAYVTVEVNGMHNALHLFISPFEEQIPDKYDEDVLYFGPGIHSPGIIQMRSGQTVYIAGGAVVYGSIEAWEKNDIKVLGRGILDQSGFERKEAQGGVSFFGCENCVIDGIIFRDPNVWTIIPAGCRDVSISNVKLIGLWRYNSDGIDIVNCEEVVIKRCFIRSFDDSIVIKGLQGRGGFETRDLPVKNIRAEKCVIWNDWGRALEIGNETCAPEMSNIHFKDCDLIRTTRAAMAIPQGDRALVKDIVFENIRFEIDDYNLPPKFQKEKGEIYDPESEKEYCPALLYIQIEEDRYSKDTERGNTRNIVLKNITVSGKQMPKTWLRGHDAQHTIEGITVENLTFNGEKITSAEQGRFEIGDFVDDIRFV
jgi:hypothetical protein